MHTDDAGRYSTSAACRLLRTALELHIGSRTHSPACCGTQAMLSLLLPACSAPSLTTHLPAVFIPALPYLLCTTLSAP
jgi:hypothetical protein